MAGVMPEPAVMNRYLSDRTLKCVNNPDGPNALRLNVEFVQEMILTSTNSKSKVDYLVRHKTQCQEHFSSSH